MFTGAWVALRGRADNRGGATAQNGRDDFPRMRRLVGMSALDCVALGAFYAVGAPAHRAARAISAL